MIIEIVSIPELQFEKVRYYTVRREGKPLTEFSDFLQRMTKDEKNKTEVGEINRYISNIGIKYGAQPGHFRDEGAAEGLPPPYHEFVESDTADDYGIRLYCIRLSPSIVILLNGDRKTSQKIQECEKCKPHFQLAHSLAKKLTEAIQAGNIEIDNENKELLIEGDFELTI